MQTTNQSKEIQWLQGLRGIACILVVLVHGRYFMLSTPFGPLADQLLIPGAAGVDLFFVISGFIMAYTTSRPGVKPVDFIRQRFTRIWPPYVVMTFFWFAFLAGGTFSSLLSPNVAIAILKSLLFIPNDPHAPLYFNVTLPLGWTLEFEAYFYLTFALSMFLGRMRWIGLFSWLIFSALIFPLSRRGLNLDVRTDLGYSFGYAALMTNPIILEFLFGVTAAAVYLSRLRIRSVRLCWNLLFITTCFALWSCYGGLYNFHGPLKWGIPVALLVTVLALVSKTITVNMPAAILWLGRISYSLYLTHTATQQLLAKFVEQNGVDVHSWGFVFLSTAAAIFVAYFFYELVEVRLCQAVRKLLTPTGPAKRLPIKETIEVRH
jgi:exopolysaccharide production protein ExoZ